MLPVARLVDTVHAPIVPFALLIGAYSVVAIGPPLNPPTTYAYPL